MQLELLLSLLAPLIPVWIFVKWLGTSDVSISAKFFGILDLRLSGLIAAYFLIAVFSIYMIAPERLGLNLSNEESNWLFNVEGPSAVEPILNGNITLRNSALSTIALTGSINDQGRDHVLRPSNSFVGDRYSFLEVWPTHVSDRLFFFGEFDERKSFNTMSVFRPADVDWDTGITEGNALTVSLKRKVNYWKILTVFAVPIIVLLFLTYIGDVKAKIDAKTKKTGSKKIPGASVKISGVLAGLVTAFVGAELLWTGIPNQLGREDELAMESCERLMESSIRYTFTHELPEEDWFDQTYRSLLHDTNFVEFAGSLEFECDSLTKEIALKGRSNSIETISRKFGADYSCYDGVAGGRNSYTWSSSEASMSRDRFFAIYETNEAGEGEAELGIILGDLNRGPSGQEQWLFFDFDGIAGRPEASVNRGEMLAYRELGSVQPPLCDEIVSRCKDFYERASEVFEYDFDTNCRNE